MHSPVHAPRRPRRVHRVHDRRAGQDSRAGGRRAAAEDDVQPFGEVGRSNALGAQDAEVVIGAWETGRRAEEVREPDREIGGTHTERRRPESAIEIERSDLDGVVIDEVREQDRGDDGGRREDVRASGHRNGRAAAGESHDAEHGDAAGSAEGVDLLERRHQTGLGRRETGVEAAAGEVEPDIGAHHGSAGEIPDRDGEGAERIDHAAGAADQIDSAGDRRGRPAGDARAHGARGGGAPRDEERARGEQGESEEYA